METFYDGKNTWMFKQDSYTRKWTLYKDNKELKSHQEWEEVAKYVENELYTGKEFSVDIVDNN